MITNRIILTMVVWGIVCTSVQADPLQNTLSSTMFTTITDSLHDSSSVAKEEVPRKIPLVKRKIDHRRQVFLAAGMMVFVALIMSSAQMWNPK